MRFPSLSARVVNHFFLSREFCLFCLGSLISVGLPSICVILVEEREGEGAILPLWCLYKKNIRKYFCRVTFLFVALRARGPHHMQLLPRTATPFFFSYLFFIVMEIWVCLNTYNKMV
jgi:hypothetical protein